MYVLEAATHLDRVARKHLVGDIRLNNEPVEHREAGGDRQLLDAGRGQRQAGAAGERVAGEQHAEGGCGDAKVPVVEGGWMGGWVLCEASGGFQWRKGKGSGWWVLHAD